MSMFNRRNKKLAELAQEQAEREHDDNVVAHLNQSEKVARDGKNYGAADAFMSIFGYTRVEKDDDE
jgi:hypothetical protein